MIEYPKIMFKWLNVFTNKYYYAYMFNLIIIEHSLKSKKLPGKKA
jgi:hypothetical protein